MAETTNQLQRIADLVTRAGAISKKQRGMRIEAEEWNTLVDILLGMLQIERLQEDSRQTQLEQRFAVREHEHLGEVTVAWLDPDLQSRIGSGTNAVSTRTTLADMDRKLVEIQKQTAQLQSMVDAHQRTLDRSAVAEIDRTKALRDFQTRFDGVANLSTLVGTLNADVGSLRTNVDTVLELRDTLRDAAGAPIDVAGIRRDVQELQQLRESFKGIDGNPLTMKDLELRLADVSTVAGVGTTSLDQRFSDFSAQLETRFNTRTDTAIHQGLTTVRTENTALADALRTEITTSAGSATAAAAAEANRLITANNDRQNATLDSRFNASKLEITNAAVEGARGIVTQQLAQVPELARAAAQSAANEVGRGITTDLQARFTAEIGTQLKATESRIDARLAPIETGLPELRSSLPGLIGSSVNAAVSTLQGTLTQQLNTQLTATQQQIQAGLNAQVLTTVNGALSNLDTRITAAVNSQMPAITTQVNSAVASATRNVNEQVSAEVGRQINALNIDAQIRSAVQSGTRDLQTTLAGQLAAQEARLTTLITKTADTLRGETKALVDVSVTNTRNDILRSVDTRISTARLNPAGPVIIR
jgi:hypothetical protein